MVHFTVTTGPGDPAPGPNPSSEYRVSLVETSLLAAPGTTLDSFTPAVRGPSPTLVRPILQTPPRGFDFPVGLTRSDRGPPEGSGPPEEVRRLGARPAGLPPCRDK